MGYSRQYYYKHCQENQKRYVIEREVLSLVHEQRKLLPRLGGKKLYYLLQPQLKTHRLKIGRDKLFDVLRHHDLLIRSKRKYVITTNSKHWLRKYPNRAKDLEVKQPEQLWVSDITYVQTDEGNCYLNLVTDAYSRKIMGYSIADNMTAETMKTAYTMALEQRQYSHPLMHHSDRGLQYCSEEYIRLSNEANVAISMTENGDPYENALAERMNKTLKDEFGLGGVLPSKQQAFRLAAEAVELYNNYRPHLSLNMKTPQNVHLQKSQPPEAVGTI